MQILLCERKQQKFSKQNFKAIEKHYKTENCLLYFDEKVDFNLTSFWSSIQIYYDKKRKSTTKRKKIVAL